MSWKDADPNYPIRLAWHFRTPEEYPREGEHKISGMSFTECTSPVDCSEYLPSDTIKWDCSKPGLPMRNNFD